MARAMTVTFLGTSSGGGPTFSRNCSSLVADILGNGSLWMVDCAEGTLRQFHLQPRKENNPSISKVRKLFVTHMHADHIMGIIPVLRNILFPPPTGPEPHVIADKPIRIEIYGPAGIRTFVRSILTMTLTRTSDRYVVHELLRPDDPITPCDPPQVMHCNEVPGRDIMCSRDGFWREFTTEQGMFGAVTVDAGSIAHRDPCLGFVMRETTEPCRKIVILGDTYDASGIIPLCVDPSPSLLIHEATDAHIPQSIDYKAKRTLETVMEKTLARGHSLPTMAGAFARSVGAQKLVLNHISGRFPAPGRNDRDSTRSDVIAEIERQATEAWGMGNARAAWDYMTVVVPAPMPPAQERLEQSWYDDRRRSDYVGYRNDNREHENSHRYQTTGRIEASSTVEYEYNEPSYYDSSYGQNKRRRNGR